VRGSRGDTSTAGPSQAAAGALAILIALAALLAHAGPAPAAPPKATFYLGLERPEREARQAFWAVGDPASPAYRSFLAAEEAAGRYGASKRDARKLRELARNRGLRVSIDPSRVFARIRGPVPRLERTFGIRLKRTIDNNVNARVWVAGQRARVPKRFRPLVREVVTTFNRSIHRQRAAAAGSGTTGASGQGPRNQGTWTDGCAEARETGSYSFGQVRKAYGIDAVGGEAGGAVALLNVGEGVAAADIADLAACFGLPEIEARTLLTDGQRAPFGQGSFEPQEDLALVRGISPGLASLTFAQTWEPPELWFLGLSELLGSPELPDALSISYGYCERDVRGPRARRATRAGARLLDSLALRLGLAGVASFASAGDFGSTCNGEPFLGVAWPSSSPFVTAVGGTRLALDAANQRAGEVAWNDTEWTPAGEGGGAGGGGLARVSPRPPYQRGLDLGGDRRATPDVSAHASMFPGWPVVLGGNWVADGGTSASAPLVASAFTAVSSAERAAGRPPLGPVNGLLYALADSAPQTLFDVVSGQTGYNSDVHARFARPGYDLATGLGVPRFDEIAAALPPPAP
jgi:kumamolisin